MMEVFQTGPSFSAELAFIDGAFRIPGYSQDAAALQTNPDPAPGLAEAAGGLYYLFHVGYDNKNIPFRKQKGD
jgi:hypothetical protein